MKVNIHLITYLIAIVALPACLEIHATYEFEVPLGLKTLDQYIPEDNPLTIEKIKLGRKLYFEESLSIDGTVSCATCHNPLLGFSDGRVVAVGINGLAGNRNTPTIINRLFSKRQFWDGRAKDLEDQVLGPIQNPIEMNNTLENLIKTLNSREEYRKDFKRVFGTDVTIDGIAKAIAAFERTIVSGNSAFDQFESGEKSALSESGKRGFELVNSEKVNCVVCHDGSNFTDEKFHNTGVGIAKEEPDWGRFTETKNDTDRARFKTPTLRDIARTAPYMHDGSLKTLMDVIDFYDKGGNPNNNLSEHMKTLLLTEQEKIDIVEFLRSLSGKNTLAFNKMQPGGN